jgi:hypothetical protein
VGVSPRCTALTTPRAAERRHLVSGATQTIARFAHPAVTPVTAITGPGMFS